LFAVQDYDQCITPLPVKDDVGVFERLLNSFNRPRYFNLRSREEADDTTRGTDLS
jgi:hypothetical protein